MILHVALGGSVPTNRARKMELVPILCPIPGGKTKMSNQILTGMKAVLLLSLISVSQLRAQDCNNNGVNDGCDISCGSPGGPCDVAGCGTKLDCNHDGIPDDCQLQPLAHLVSSQSSPFDHTHSASFLLTDLRDAIGDVTITVNAQSTLFFVNQNVLVYIDNEYMGTLFDGATDCQSSTDSLEVSQAFWNSHVLATSSLTIGLYPNLNVPGCAGSYVEVVIEYPYQNDCNVNSIPDDCDIASGFSQDCNGNGVPDSCSLDCNVNNLPDECEIFNHTVQDCNQNRIPDVCEVPPNGPASNDCNLNGIPDSCEEDCNGNGYPDDCDLTPTLALFSPIRNYAVLDQPWAINHADLDGDGDQDLIICDFFSQAVSVLRNVGDGSFLSAAHYTVGSRPEGVAAGDFDADGDTDLAVANFNSPFISVLRNRGNGTFLTQVQYAGTSGATGIVAQDLDEDGDIDVAVSSWNSDNATVLINNGRNSSGTWLGFAAATNYAVGDAPASIATADFNGDGKPDLVTTNYQSNNISVLLNAGLNGGGTWQGFAAQQTFASGSGVNSVSTDDWDDDGDVDVAVVNRDADNLQFYLNNGIDGLGVWQGLLAPTTLAVHVQPRFVTSADFNNDGRLDLAVTSAGFPSVPGTTVSIFQNSGGQGADWQGFSALQDFRTGLSPYGITATDLDGDGDKDLGVCALDSDEAWIMINQGAGQFPLNGIYITGHWPWYAVAGDVDLDLDNDLVVANRQSGTLSLLKNNSDGSFAAPVNFASSVDAPESVAIGDLDGDSDKDIAVACYGSNNVRTYLNQGLNGSGVWQGFSGGSAIATGSNPDSVAIAQLDGQNNNDIAVLNGNSSTLTILLNQGGTTYAAAVNYPVGPAPRQLAYGDFDADGDIDFLVANGDGGNARLLKNNGDGTFAGAQLIPCDNQRSITAKDFDNDGDIDFAVAKTCCGIKVFLNQGGSGAGWLGFSAGVDYVTTANSFWIHADDINGDGLADLALVEQQQHAFRVLLNIGNGTFLPALRSPAANSPQFISSGDFTGDNLPELVITSSISEIVLVVDNESLGSASPDCNTNLLPDDCETPGDFDDDGDIDINDLEAYISGLISGGCSALADLNGDGNADGLDIQVLVNILIN